MYPTDLKVGEIVILKPKNKHSPDRHGFKAFIEEIIVNPTSKEDLERYGFSDESLRTNSGVYSLYGFDPNDFFGHIDWYVGDTLGDDFERTGESLSENDLKRLHNKVSCSHHHNAKFLEDILLMGKNLGRTTGRNEEKPLTA